MRMHKTLFFIFYFFQNVFSKFLLGKKHVIECSIDAFEDVWCTCKCM